MGYTFFVEEGLWLRPVSMKGVGEKEEELSIQKREKKTNSCEKICTT